MLFFFRDNSGFRQMLSEYHVRIYTGVIDTNTTQYNPTADQFVVHR